MITFNKIVNKLLKKGGKVIFKDDIFDIVDPDLDFKNTSLVYKIIYRLKREGIIIPLRNGVYIVPDEEDKKLNEIDLIEKYYYIFVKKYITKYAGNDYFLSGKKALELNIKDFSINEKIIVITRNINKKVFFGRYVIIFKTIKQNKINLYSKISKMTKKINIEGNYFKIANLELSLLQSSVVEENDMGFDINFLNKIIKKYKNYFVFDNFYYIGSLKYIIAFNRLKEISKSIDDKLYQVFLDIIKKNGGLFVGSGLRKI